MARTLASYSSQAVRIWLGFQYCGHTLPENRLNLVSYGIHSCVELAAKQCETESNRFELGAIYHET